MVSRQHDDEDFSPKPRRRQPAKTPEARENELISLALDVAEEQMRSGVASSQLLTHFAKSGSMRERLEREKLANENAKLRKQIDEMNMAVEIKDLLDDALQAFRGYSGDLDENELDEEY